MQPIWPWVTGPTLLLDETRARRNIRRMVERAQRAGVRLRPHFKTHQSIEIGEWFRERGVVAITVSSLRMADFFVSAGWHDVTVAFPLNIRELPLAAGLARRCRLGLLVESVDAIVAAGEAIQVPIDLWLEADTGYLRSGLPSQDVERFAALIDAAHEIPHLQVRGILTHTGQSYAERSAVALHRLHAETTTALAMLQRELSAHPAMRGMALELSVGDTPLCSVSETFAPAVEIRPGNFVFHDWTQVEIGSCSEDEIAVALAAPVVGIYPERREVVIYGGAVHLSKDWLTRADGRLEYGRVALPAEYGWGPALPDVFVRSLSQEHGTVRAEVEAWERYFSRLRVGDLLCILPVHSCLTADLMKAYRTVDGRRISMMRLDDEVG